MKVFFSVQLTILLKFTISVFGTNGFPENDRLDCWLSDAQSYESACKDLGCLWDNTTQGIPWCFFPKAGYGYKVVAQTTPSTAGFSLGLRRFDTKGRFPGSLDNIRFDVEYLTENIVRTKFSDVSARRYEVPVSKTFRLLKERRKLRLSDTSYQVVYQNDEQYGFRFQVQRKHNNISIFDTSIGGLTLSNQFLQVASYLPSSNIYGIGENVHATFKHKMNYMTWPLFSRDSAPEAEHKNYYSVHPFYSCLETDGSANGVLLLNSNAMEYTMMPAPALSVRTVGGILDLFFFIGDNPEHVVQLYTQLIGRTFMPPYWALGFQLSRFGYLDLNNVEKVINRTRDAQIPQDVQMLDLDYMEDRKDFTWNRKFFKDLDLYINRTKDEGMKWVLILDPGILASDRSYQPYVEGEQLDLFVHWPKDIPISQRSNPPFVDVTHGFVYGRVWPSGPVAFPDFLRNGTREWWKKSMGRLYQDLKFDGVWIDMNEPSNMVTNRKEAMSRNLTWHLMCPQNYFDDPFYLPMAARAWGKSSRLSDQTLCMCSVQGDQDEYRHYDVHSLYGWSEMEPTMRAARELTGERSMVFSRSTFPSSGVHGGHWLGDTTSTWTDLRRSIIGILEFNLFGIPYIGSDICGFTGVPTIELCKRWMQLGAFYPLSRNHNNLLMPPQDPAYFGGELAAASQRALNIRYRLLPYLYTLFFRAHLNGSTVVRALFHEFPGDPVTYSIDTQFLWGPALLISPVLNEGQSDVVAYLPEDTWYDYHTGMVVTTTAVNVTVHSPEDPPLHIRGGYILPTQDPALNTKTSRWNPFSLLVYPKNLSADGELFWDDGTSQDTIEKNEYLHLRMSVRNRTMTIENLSPPSEIKLSFFIRDVLVFGVESFTSQSQLRGSPTESLHFNKEKMCLTVTVNLNVTRSLPTTFISW